MEDGIRAILKLESISGYRKLRIKTNSNYEVALA